MREDNSLLIYGLGFSGQALARLALADQWTVTATVRTSEKAAAMRATFPELNVIALDHPDAPEHLQRSTVTASHILMSAPTAEQANGVHDDPYLSVASPDWFESATWVGYLSTTVVYGDWQGEWVDETSETRSVSVRGRRRLEAEKKWSTLWVPVHIFRLAGIYGPGRNALETVRKGRARIIDKPGQVFSRIHVEDIADVVWASMNHATAQPGKADIFNVCDDEPCEPRIVIRHACDMLGVAPPQPVAFEDAGLSAMGRSFYEDNKRVSNAKARSLLGRTLRYPSYREGLAVEFKRLN